MEITESVKLPSPKLPDGYNKHVFPDLLLCQNSSYQILVNPQGFTVPLFFGIIEITVSLCEMKEWDLS